MMKLLDQTKALVRREWTTGIRFLLVGVSAVLLKLALYALFSRALWVDGSRTLENFAAILLAQVYNFFASRYWTFRTQKPAPGSHWRYTAVTVFGIALESALFYLGAEILKLYDLVVIIVNTGIVSLVTYTIHRAFTFHPDPYRRRTDVVQSG